MVSQEQFLADLKELLSTNEDIDMDVDLLEIDCWDSFSAVSFLAMIYEKYGIEGLFMTEDQRKALPDSASGTTPVSQIGITDSDRDLEYAAQKRANIMGENTSARKYV